MSADFSHNLNNRSTPLRSAAGADLDPEIRRFVREVGEAFRRYPNFNDLPPPDMRQIGEKVRASWAAGGPAMIKRQDRIVPTLAGEVCVRVHNPSVRSGKPALIYMHGGGWTLFSIDTHDRLMREYAARADVVVIGVDYALAPEAKFPIPLEQVVHVIRWAREHSGELDIDADRIALGGDSAGGNLALAASIQLRDAGESETVRALVLNYGCFDTHCSAEALQRYGGADYMLGADEMTWFWNNYLRTADDATHPLACPSNADLRGLPPTSMAIAECDILCEQNERMAEQLKSAGVAVDAAIYPGASHSFLEAMSISALSNRAIDATAQWLRKLLQSA